MLGNKNIILDHKQIVHKIRRIAYQVYESNINENEVVIAGIEPNGYVFAKKVKSQLEKISDIKVNLCKVTIDKKNPRKPIVTSISENDYKNKSLILVDDVLNSGTTLVYGVKYFLDVPLKQFKTAVLVNRNHKKYPVKADYKGISLSTSLKEHVTVKLVKDYEVSLE
ncbi:MAG: phosphoribosyltransferase [Bacteroidia bacterium]|nr:phosphoribosyltransferase [Bacteroidia bacterium]NND11812.1 phosphoribosyltransferase [Flavobacteriaceae bacterium]MBT8311137.1 phosphoribosyltransferase [Bacteroidia bacterium]NNK27276.1 phosphoribosyltransferase [Flavobacteriaceae bacterium]RZV55933.1 MAG: phosphoribosyltransferase [Flavobacteriaceae bacterium]